MEQKIEGLAPEQQAEILVSEEDADETAETSIALPPQQQNCDEQQDSQPAPKAAAKHPIAATNSQSAARTTSTAIATNNQTGDAVESEPYRWHECTVGINITLIPDPIDKEHYQTALIGIRTHSDAPIVRRVAAGELLPLPSCIMEMVREMREQLPARAEHLAERTARAAQAAQAAKSPVAKITLSAKTKAKPGRHIASQSAGAPPAAIEQEMFDDDLFSTPAAHEANIDAEGQDVETAETALSTLQQEEAENAAVSKATVTHTSAHGKNRSAQTAKHDKHGRALEPKSPATPENQLSLL